MTASGGDGVRASRRGARTVGGCRRSTPRFDALEARALLSTLRLVDGPAMSTSVTTVLLGTTSASAGFVGDAAKTLAGTGGSESAVSGGPYLVPGQANASNGLGFSSSTISASVLGAGREVAFTATDDVFGSDASGGTNAMGSFASGTGASNGDFVTLEIVPEAGESAGDPVRVTIEFGTHTNSMDAHVAGVVGSYAASYRYNGAATQIDAGSLDDLAFADGDSAGFDARIGDRFAVKMSVFGSNIPFDGVGNLRLTSEIRARVSQPVGVPNLTPTSLVASSAAGGGYDLGYSIAGADLDDFAAVGLYWASGPTFADAIPGEDGFVEPIYAVPAGPARGAYGPIHVNAATLGPPPAGATYLLAVVDPDDVVAESNEGDNVLALPLSSDLVATRPTLVADGGVEYGYSIAGADLTIGSTAALYWASGTTFATVLGGPIDSVDTDTSVGSYGPIRVSKATLGDAPAGARYLLVAVDPQGAVPEADETNNVAFLALPPDLAVTSLAFSAGGQGVDLSYRISRADLPRPTTVALYWAKGRTVDDVLGPAIRVETTGTAAGTFGPIHVSTSALGEAPDGASYLIAVADADHLVDEADESNNVLALKLQGVTLTSLAWHKQRHELRDATGGGVDFSYQVSSAVDPGSKISVYWASSEDPRDILGGAVYTATVDGSRGRHSVSVPAMLLGTPPAGAQALIVAVEPAGGGQDFLALTATAEDVLRDSVRVQLVGARINALFEPLGGALTIDQAAALVGVDHFNWIQHITAVPHGWIKQQIWRDVVIKPDGKLDGYVLQDGDDLAPYYQDDTPIRTEDLELPIVDPIVQDGGLPDTIAVIAVSDAGRLIYYINMDVGQYGSDDKIYYLDESSPNANEAAQVVRYRDVFHLGFTDTPELNADSVDEGFDFMAFETRLAGVRADGSPVTWDGLNVNFTWKTDAVAGGGGTAQDRLYFRATPDQDAPPARSGGVFDVQGVPIDDAPPTNAAPIIDDPGPLRVAEGGSLAFAVHATAGPGETLRYRLVEGPAGATIDPATGVFSWRPTRPGTYAATVRVVDDGPLPAGSSRTFTIRVDDVAPAVDLGPDAALVQAETFDRVGSFSDPGAGPWTATVDYGDGSGVRPLDLRPDGTFTLHHAYATPGSYRITVTVDDGAGGVGVGTLAAVVAPSQSTPVDNPPVVAPSGYGAARDAFVTSLYRTQLGRAPESAGLRFWARRLAAGASGRKVAAAIWRSPERRLHHPATTLPASFRAAVLAARIADRPS